MRAPGVRFDRPAGFIQKVFARFHVRVPSCSDGQSNWIVNGDKLGAVGKRSFHLHFVNHFRDAFHHLVAFQNCCAETHDLGDALSIAGCFHDFGGENRDGFDVIQLQAARLALRRATSAATTINNFSCSRGVRCTALLPNRIAILIFALLALEQSLIHFSGWHGIASVQAALRRLPQSLQPG